MNAPLSPSVAAALRLSAEATPRLATSGLSSPGDVAGQFAAMLASLRDGAATAGQDAAATAAAQPAATGPLSTGAAMAAETGEHRVALSAVSLMMEDAETPAPVYDENGLRRRAPAPADVSGQVVEQAVASGAPSDGRWMATLMATGQPAADVAA